MAKKYNGYSNATNTTSTTVPLIQLGNTSASATRGLVYDFVVGSDASPADAAAKFSWRRTTARGGSPSSVTGNPLNSVDPAAALVYDTTSTTPTITASSDIFQWAQNQRVTFRWVAAPGGELQIAAANSVGIGLMPVGSSATANYVFTVHWEE